MPNVQRERRGPRSLSAMFSSGVWILITILMLGSVLLACVRREGPSGFVLPPIMEAEPQEVECDFTPGDDAGKPIAISLETTKEKCMVVLKRDFENMVLVIKEGCLMGGGTKYQCGIIENEVRALWRPFNR